MKNKKNNFKSELETQYSLLIKANKEEQRKILFAIIFILTLTLLSCLITSYFSYKAYNNFSSNKKTEIEEAIHYETLSIMYNNTSSINIDDIQDISDESKTITITNNGDTDMLYDINITSVNTNLVNNSNLVYTLTKNNRETIKNLPLTDTTIIKESRISPQETVVYTFKIKYNAPVENRFLGNYKAKIAVEQVNNNINLLE